MRIITNFITLFSLFGAMNFASAQCGPTQVDLSTQLVGICEGDSETVNFTPVGTCSGNYEYQVETSTNAIIQPWSTLSQYTFTPTNTDTYTVYARCSACPTTVVFDTVLVEVVQTPTIVADTFVCYGTSANFSASGSPAGTMSWWDSETGGTQLSPNENYTSPPMTANDSVFLRVTGTVTGGGNQGSILITEAGLEGFAGGTGSEDYLEISNLFSNNVNTAGWVAAVSDSYSNINSVNNTLWYLPNSFAPCSIISKTDVNGSSNYWGSNIFWNPNQPGWAIILDDVGNIADFVAWGWSTTQLAGFNVTINGYNITLGTEWVGNSCPSNCSAVGTTPYSLSRIGNTDNNDAGDFVCQATSLNVVNPSLSCGWVTSNITCPYPVSVTIDSLPSASAPNTTTVACYADVPAPDATIITDATDDYTTSPTVQYMGEVSDGALCPETLTRTYRVTDSCSNFVDVNHIIIINDTVAPVMEAAPADLFVACYADVPPMDSLDWTDNCLGSGTAIGTEVSNGSTCPEVLTRTWTVTDTCGNTATEVQTITINDTIAPVIDPAPADLAIQCPSDLPPMVSLDWTDNCSGNGVLNGQEVSDGLSCPETITRTWTVSDGCGNTSTETQVIVINDITPPTASNLPTLQLAVLPPADSTLVTDAADNCGTPIVEWVGDESDNGFCPENVTRTYSVTDDCGNVTFITRNFIIGDNIPNVSFFADPTILDNLSSGIVEFDNNTIGADTYTWDFGDGSPISNEINPSHQFDISSSTTYDVWLVATSEFGCKDSAVVTINVFQELIYFVPNAFTPDGDGLNQTFKPVFAAGFDPNDYNLLIFNRWGEVLFESNNDQVGWDGTYGGKVVQEGTYLYKIEFGLKDDDSRKIVTGHVTLLK